MIQIIRKSTNVPSVLVWLTLWLSLFLAFGCLWSIPILAIPGALRHHGEIASVAELKPLIVLAGMVAAMSTWLTWYDKKSGVNTAETIESTIDVRPRRKYRQIGRLLTVLVVMLECLWMFTSPGTHANWFLLVALNAGCVTSWIGFCWTQRQIALMKVVRDGDDVLLSFEKKLVLPELLVDLLIFIYCFALILLAFTPVGADLFSHNRNDIPLITFFALMFCVITYFIANAIREARRDAWVQYALTQDNGILYQCLKGTKHLASDIYASFTGIGLMFFVVNAIKAPPGIPIYWHLFFLCTAAGFVIFLLLRWTISRPYQWP